MLNIGMFCFLGRGHLNPGSAVGRSLAERGHEVTVFHLTIAQAAVRASNLKFIAIDRQEDSRSDYVGWRLSKYLTWIDTLDAISSHVVRVLREGPDAIREAGAAGIIADQFDLAAGTVAEYLNRPCLTLSCAPPMCFDSYAPSPF